MWAEILFLKWINQFIKQTFWLFADPDTLGIKFYNLKFMYYYWSKVRIYSSKLTAVMDDPVVSKGGPGSRGSGFISYNLQTIFKITWWSKICSVRGPFAQLK